MLFETLTFGVAIYDPTDDGQDFVFVDLNPAGGTLSHVSREDVVGKRVTEAFPGIEEMGLLEVFRRVYRTGEPENHPAARYVDDRGEQWFENYVFKLPSGQIATVYQDSSAQRRAQEALRASEARFREMAELLPEAVFETDASLRLTYVNKKAFDLFGYTQEEFDAGLNAMDMLHPEDRPRAMEAFRKRVSGTDPGMAEYTCLGKDGTTVPILFHATTLYEGEAVVGVRGLLVDLTERRQTEAELLESGRRFQTIVESSPMGMHLYQLQDGNRLVFVGANPAADEILGVDNSTFIGRTVEEAFPHLADSEIPKRYKEAAAEGIEWRSEQVSYDEGGIRGVFEVVAFQTSPGQMVAMFRDVAERVKARQALERSEERFRSVVDQSNDALYILFQNRFDLVNPRFCEITGVPPEEATSPEFDFWSLVAEESKPLIRERQRKRERGEKVPDVYEFQIQPKTGPKVHVEASVTEIDYAHDKAILGILRDTTEQKTLENQLHQAQKMESIGRLSGGVAHDLNNLLTPIIGYAELLRDDLSPGDARRASAHEIIQAGGRAKDLVRQLLAFSRRQTLDFSPTNLNALVLGFERLLRRTIRENIEMRVNPKAVNSTIRADKGQIEQVLMNLAVNAQDAMPHGGIVDITTEEAVFDEAFSLSRPGVKPGNYVLLSFTDTGEGMDEETKDRVFEPFFTTKPSGQGTGLGLATVYGIIKQHGGNVWAYSDVGKGTTFKCYFPLAEGAVPTEERSTIPATGGEGGTETIFVVEDEDAVRNLAGSILKRAGYTVTAARDAEDCLKLLENLDGPLDLLLTDVVLPGLNGRQLFDEVSSLFPNSRVLFMSGYADDVVFRMGAAGEDLPFLQKPFSVQALARKVREVLDEG